MDEKQKLKIAKRALRQAYVALWRDVMMMEDGSDDHPLVIYTMNPSRLDRIIRAKKAEKLAEALKQFEHEVKWVNHPDGENVMKSQFGYMLKALQEYEAWIRSEG